MAAWLLRFRPIVQLHSDFAPIQFNTALCLALIGLACIALDRAWRGVTVAMSAIVMAIACATAAEYGLGSDLGLDQVFVDASFATVRTLLPGRMSPQTVSALIIVSLVIFASTIISERRRASILGVGGCIVGCYAITASIGYASAIYEASGWLGFSRVSPQAITGFFLVAVSLVTHAWSMRGKSRMPGWIVPAVVSTSWIVGVILFVGLRQLETRETASALPHVVLAALVSLGCALGAALVLYRRTADARRAALEAKERLELMMQRMVHAELVNSLALAQTQQGVWDLNLVTGEPVVDEGFRKIIGRDPEVKPMADETWGRAIHPDDIAEVRGRLHAAISGGDLFEAQFRVKVADGSWRWIDSRGRIVERDASGRALRMLGIIRDITEQQQNREQLRLAEEALHNAQKLEAVGRLAGGIAHHINNKMTVVLGRADLLTYSSAPQDRVSIDSIMRAAEETADICRQLLAYGRRQFLRPAAFDANVLLEGMRASLIEALGSRARLSIALAAAPTGCFADADQIEWVIRRLVTNALDAIGSGGAVEISTAETDIGLERGSGEVAPGRYVAIHITDNGAGLSEEALAHVFEPFFGAKGIAEAQGLGLATCYGILKQSNGHLLVKSNQGRGSTFTLLLPCAQPVV